jgi:hypothetical protein
VAETGGVTRAASVHRSDLWQLFLAVGGMAYAKSVRVARQTGAADKQLAELRQ